MPQLFQKQTSYNGVTNKGVTFLSQNQFWFVFLYSSCDVNIFAIQGRWVLQRDQYTSIKATLSFTLNWCLNYHTLFRCPTKSQRGYNWSKLCAFVFVPIKYEKRTAQRQSRGTKGGQIHVIVKSTLCAESQFTITLGQTLSASKSSVRVPVITTASFSEYISPSTNMLLSVEDSFVKTLHISLKLRHGL